MEPGDRILDQYKEMRWDGSLRGHYEAWYTTVNQLTTGAGFWIRYTLHAPVRGEPGAQVWFTSFVPGTAEANVAAVQRYSIDQVATTRRPFTLQVGPSSFQPGRITGMLDASGSAVTWDLVYEGVTDPLQYLPDPFYRTRWVRSKLLVPHPFLSIGGKIQIRDHQFILNSDPGQQGHVWGSRHAEEWTWFHCSSFVEEGGEPVPGYVTGISAQQRWMGALPPLSFGHLVWKESHLHIRPATVWRNRWDGPWHWRGMMGEEEVTITLSLPWKEMVLAVYDDPAGHNLYCHHSDRADCSVRFQSPRRPPRVFRSAGMAHVEIGSRSPDPRATRRVQILD